MSHELRSKVFVTALDEARAAGADVGLQLQENVRTYRGFENFTCQHKLVQEHAPMGAHEVGLKPRQDGQPGWELAYDNYGGAGRQLEEKVGVDCSILKAHLAKHALTRAAVQAGYSVTTTVDATGQIHVQGLRY